MSARTRLVTSRRSVVRELELCDVQRLQEAYSLREAVAVADQHPGCSDAAGDCWWDEHRPEGLLRAGGLLDLAHIRLGPRAPHHLGVSRELSRELGVAGLCNAEVDLLLHCWDLHYSGVSRDRDCAPQHRRWLSRRLGVEQDRGLIAGAIEGEPGVQAREPGGGGDAGVGGDLGCHLAPGR